MKSALIHVNVPDLQLRAADQRNRVNNSRSTALAIKA